MIITQVTNDVNIRYAYLNIFPDQFKSEKEKLENDSWVKNTMDYFANVAFAEYKKHRETFVKNYDLMKGIIDYDHFYQEPEVRDFTETVFKSQELPKYVKHYPILNPVVSTMLGELSKRPDIHRVRAFDDDSQSEELEYKTDMIQQLIMQEAKRIIYNKAAIRGEELSEEDLTNLTFERIKEDMTEYTSLAERWGNHMLTALKMEFNTKEKSEDAFRDLLITSREYYHIYEDNSNLGFNVEVLNPKNVWYKGVPDSKYTSAISGDGNTPYAIGTVHVMEISEIIEKFPWLTEKEIDHLRTSLQDYGLVNVRKSNLFTDETGIDAIKYDTYNRLILQERMMIESEMKENNDELIDWLGLTNSTASFGFKYTVTRAYWISKKKVGKLTFWDGEEEQTILVDENYVEGTPGEISLEWGWVNQWYQGTRIGPDIFDIRPFKLLGYSPIIGVIHEIKNTTPTSLVDLMKTYQVLYNICMNQLWELLNKEIGNVARINLRRIPKPKDGDNQDAIELWEEEARRRGVMWDDDSPENTQAPSNNQTIAGAVDLTRSAEIQSRYNLAIGLKQECWELVGMNRQRLGAPLATETATANQNALVQSFAQTEPYFSAHNYVLNQLYQALLDAAQYIESTKPVSSVNYITGTGEGAYVEISGQDLRLRDLKVFVTSRAEDQQLFQEFRQLSQAMVQNGATIYEISQLYTTNSIRQMQKVFKDLKQKQEEFAQQSQELESNKLLQTQQIAQAQLEEEAKQRELDRISENYNKEQDRITKERVAIITATGFGKVQSEDLDADTIPDVLEASRLSSDIVNSQSEQNLKLRELNQKSQEIASKKEIEMEKLKVARENMKNDKDIAKINAKNRNKTKK